MFCSSARVGRRCGDEAARRFESYTFAAWAKSILDRFRLALPDAYRPTSDYVLDFDFGRSARLEERLLGIAESVGVTQAQVRGLDLPEFYRTSIASNGIRPEIEATPGTRLALTRALWQNALFGGARSVLDFQMIGSLAELILRSNPRLLTAMRVSYRYVFLDEFQDTTANQFNLLNTAFAGSASRVVAHMVDRLNEPESRFHGSLVTNVLDLVEILPRLNVNGDTDLNRFAEQVKERLCNYSAQDLKKHDLLRVTTAADAANIVAEMDGLLRSREAAEFAQGPSADDIFNRMSAYMEAPAAA